MKASTNNGSKSITIKTRLAFFLFAFVASFIIVLRQQSHILRIFHTNDNVEFAKRGVNKITLDKALEFLEGLDENTRIGLVNLQKSEVRDSGIKGKLNVLNFEKVSENVTWKDLFPTWIPEEFEYGLRPTCPDFPIPDFSTFQEVDLVIAHLPCQHPNPGWNKDVYRLQVHLVAANLALKKGRRNKKGDVKLVFKSSCEPMIDIFRCDDLVRKEGNSWWMYEIDVTRLEEKVRSPPGSCQLVLPLRVEGNNKGFNVTNFKPLRHQSNQREAYVTVLFSTDAYVCGAITLAYSIRKTGSTRDLILLHDEFLSPAQLGALRSSGWDLRRVEHIRTPNSHSGGLYEYKYSKFRIFQLTDYDKLVFIDADILVLRNLDILFSFPAVSARENNHDIFNSGMMVLEPSNCTYESMMRNIEIIHSYNGGDQGFLNEFFVWWHRLPKRTIFLKMTWENTTVEKTRHDSMYAADPPQLYAIHYLGLKPWVCYRDYDCNWDWVYMRKFANDEAHWRWWRMYDEIDENLKAMCTLSVKQKSKLELWRSEAEERGFGDAHWNQTITDPRKED